MTRLLIVLCLIAAGIAGGAWWAGPQQDYDALAPAAGAAAGAMAGAGAVDAADTGLHMPPAEHYDPIKQRPLFIEGRRPLPDDEGDSTPEAPPAPPPNKTPPPRIAISGILITPQDRYAMLRNPPKDGPSRLRTGDNFQGWVVEDIQRDSLTLRQGGETQEISLWEYQQVPLPVLPPGGEGAAPSAAQPAAQAGMQPPGAVPLPAAVPGRADARDPRTRRPIAPARPAAPAK